MCCVLNLAQMAQTSVTVGLKNVNSYVAEFTAATPRVGKWQKQNKILNLLPNCGHLLTSGPVYFGAELALSVSLCPSAHFLFNIDSNTTLAQQQQTNINNILVPRLRNPDSFRASESIWSF